MAFFVGGLNREGPLGPVLCGVVDAQNFDALLPQAVDGDIGQGRKQKLAGSFLASGTASMGRLFQGTDGLVQLANGRLPVLRRTRDGEPGTDETFRVSASEVLTVGLLRLRRASLL